MVADYSAALSADKPDPTDPDAVIDFLERNPDFARDLNKEAIKAAGLDFISGKLGGAAGQAAKGLGVDELVKIGISEATSHAVERLFPFIESQSEE